MNPTNRSTREAWNAPIPPASQIYDDMVRKTFALATMTTLVWQYSVYWNRDDKCSPVYESCPYTFHHFVEGVCVTPVPAGLAGLLSISIMEYGRPLAYRGVRLLNYLVTLRTEMWE